MTTFKDGFAIKGNTLRHAITIFNLSVSLSFRLTSCQKNTLQVRGTLCLNCLAGNSWDSPSPSSLLSVAARCCGFPPTLKDSISLKGRSGGGLASVCRLLATLLGGSHYHRCQRRTKEAKVPGWGEKMTLDESSGRFWLIHGKGLNDESSTSLVFRSQHDGSPMQKSLMVMTKKMRRWKKWPKKD